MSLKVLKNGDKPIYVAFLGKTGSRPINIRPLIDATDLTGVTLFFPAEVSSVDNDSNIIIIGPKSEKRTGMIPLSGDYYYNKLFLRSELRFTGLNFTIRGVNLAYMPPTASSYQNFLRSASSSDGSIYTLDIQDNNSALSYVGFMFLACWELDTGLIEIRLLNGRYQNGNVSNNFSIRGEAIGLDPVILATYNKSFSSIYNASATLTFGPENFEDYIPPSPYPPTPFPPYTPLPKPEGSPIATLYYNKSDAEHVTKDIEPIMASPITFNRPTDILHPVIDIRYDNLDDIILKANYMYIDSLGRYYYITRKEILKTNLIRLEGKVDVLMSYAADIRKQKAVIRRQANKYNLNLDDDNIKFSAKRIIRTQKFPKGFDSPCFVVVVAGPQD